MQHSQGGGCSISWKKPYKGVWFNVTRVTRGWMYVIRPEKTLHNI